MDHDALSSSDLEDPAMLMQEDAERDYAEEGEEIPSDFEAYWRRYCPEHDTDHLEAGRCPIDNVTMEIRGQLELAIKSEVKPA